MRLGNHIAGRLLGIPIESIDAVRAQNATAFTVLTILVCVFISFLFHSRMRLERLKAEAESEKARASAIEKQAMQAQLQLLQAQIEPHMLFNTLANLQGLIAVDPARAQHMLDQFILYLRATLSSSRAEKTTLAHEFSLIDAYLGLMSVRMGTRLSYTLDLPRPCTNCISRQCCCSPWSKTRSSTAWNRKSAAATSTFMPALKTAGCNFQWLTPGLDWNRRPTPIIINPVRMSG